jgi:hypothetical protein
MASLLELIRKQRGLLGCRIAMWGEVGAQRDLLRNALVGRSDSGVTVASE